MDARQYERMLLAAILTNPQKQGDIIKESTPELFSDPWNREAIISIKRIFSKGAPLSATSIAQEMNGDFTSNLREAGSLYAEYVGAGGHTTAITELRAAFILRTLNSSLKTIAQSIEEGKLSDALREVAGIPLAVKDTGASIASIKTDADAIEQAISIVDTRRKNPQWVIGGRSGIKQLDIVTGGFQRGYMYTIGARPSTGKTAFVLQCMMNFKAQGYNGIFISLETQAHRLMLRSISERTGIKLMNLSRGFDNDGNAISDELMDQIRLAGTQLAQNPIHIYDGTKITASNIVDYVNTVGIENKVDFLIVDFIQLMSSGFKGSGAQSEADMAAVSRSLKTIALELNVAVLGLSQLNRSSAGRADRRPAMSDLRGSGGIEQDSDTVILLYSPGNEGVVADENGVPYPPNYLEFIVAKNKDGARASIPSIFDGSIMQFKDYKKPSEQPEGDAPQEMAPANKYTTANFLAGSETFAEQLPDEEVPF